MDAVEERDASDVAETVGVADDTAENVPVREDEIDAVCERDMEQQTD